MKVKVKVEGEGEGGVGLGGDGDGLDPGGVGCAPPDEGGGADEPEPGDEARAALPGF